MRWRPTHRTAPATPAVRAPGSGCPPPGRSATRARPPHLRYVPRWASPCGNSRPGRPSSRPPARAGAGALAVAHLWHRPCPASRLFLWSSGRRRSRRPGLLRLLRRGAGQPRGHRRRNGSGSPWNGGHRGGRTRGGWRANVSLPVPARVPRRGPPRPGPPRPGVRPPVPLPVPSPVPPTPVLPLPVPRRPSSVRRPRPPRRARTGPHSTARPPPRTGRPPPVVRALGPVPGAGSARPSPRSRRPPVPRPTPRCWATRAARGPGPRVRCRAALRWVSHRRHGHPPRPLPRRPPTCRCARRPGPPPGPHPPRCLRRPSNVLRTPRPARPRARLPRPPRPPGLSHPPRCGSGGSPRGERHAQKVRQVRHVRPERQPVPCRRSSGRAPCSPEGR